MINVTKTYLPPLEEYVEYLKGIWERSHVTNNGPLVKQLEAQLKEYLGVEQLLFCGNGTIVLQMALKVFNITQEVITTPFSYCASTTAIVWENVTPVFADIDPNTLCIDPRRVEALITDQTQAILATHVYGHPCDVEALQAIADRYGLKLIYDAAHVFGATLNGQSLLSFGDISTCSFHATKVFHTIEGGCIIANDADVLHQLGLYRSFGHIYDDYLSVGINGKNSEFHAAMGLCNLPRVDDFIQRRKEISLLYEELLEMGKLTRPKVWHTDFNYNYAYFPVIFDSETTLLRVKSALEQVNIFPRRYFYPSLNTLPYVPKGQCPISDDLANRVLCLPLFVELADEDVRRISQIVNQHL
ncbi:MAG: DegT/DnrJ/EryC1/StrS family aminotransferase [Spirosomataceae bacterium]